ncbi:polyphosphate kinase 2 [Oceanicella actignis]|uniref:ADP/GDP-polyphosphate phosphotransferase n=1 Tax=Oceanicella actignis TaxID=1189325 RepID=A0A1M7TZD2_9RHOB|nr:polyphosphate kinase 2 [Oceanicella actignis]SET83049.1 polyphosphate kinase 2, PA0141 family [Oceanicella actignis]SHN76055.1 polyphosphate kinase 2, PA0141 family [Oceanicella actignis]
MTDPARTPFDGAVTRFFESEAPDEIRETVRKARDDSVILDPNYPYPRRLGGKEYREAYRILQIELVKLQAWMAASGHRLIAVFEGRDAAGKGGAIRRVTENLNPRRAHVVALPAPTEAERGQWYFQRYVRHFPTSGEMALFDRSWYNRAVVERVFGFSTAQERERFFLQVPGIEQALVSEGVTLLKFWLTISRAEQLRRFLARERDPLKQWKLSRIDVESLGRWNDYTDAIREMFGRTHIAAAPWTVVRADDKRRARLEIMRAILSAVDYEGRDPGAIGRRDPAIAGDPLTIPLA